MRRTFRVFLLLTLAFALCGGALAGGVMARDIIVISLDQCYADSEYALILTKTGANIGSISSGDIFYINQFTADSDRVEVAVVFPGFETCDVYVGGTFRDNLASPRKLGTYAASSTPGQLTDIEAGAFESSAFTCVFLGDQVNRIGARAFADNPSLSYIYIPDSVDEIAEDAFDGCGSLVIGCANGSAAHRFAVKQGIAFKLL